MRILALEPYYGGSHRAFLNDWIERSRHSWTVYSLPSNKWKWRMRHAAITFSESVARDVESGRSWDAIFCSDMLSLAEFLGLSPEPVRCLPALVYFHENQLTYPVQHEKEYDYHFAFSNLTSALAARRVWFNSAYHRDAFLEEMMLFLRRMPDHQPLKAVEKVRARAHVRSPRVAKFPPRAPRPSGPLHILWAARWEYDKDPETFFDALRRLRARGVAFELSVIGGGAARNVSGMFAQAADEFRGHIRHWGYLETREEYCRVLGEADVAVSTALHEFFGISMVEAVAAGAFPLAPARLAYPEILGRLPAEVKQDCFYEDGAAGLARRLEQFSARTRLGSLWGQDPLQGARAVEPYSWQQGAVDLDDEFAELATPAG